MSRSHLAVVVAVQLAACRTPEPRPDTSHRDRSAPVSAPAGASLEITRNEVWIDRGEFSIGADVLSPPPAAAPRAGVVIIQGAGDSPRGNLWAQSIAEALARRGLVVLYPDKRGSGASGGDWKTSSFDDLAADVVAEVAVLRGVRGVAPDRVGVLGLSQGGWVAPLVALSDPSLAFVAVVSTSSLPFAATVNHEMEQTFRQAGVDGAALEQAMALQRAALRYARDPDTWPQYESLLAEALDGPGRAVAEGYPAAPDHWKWAFLRKVVDYDPMSAWTRVRAPTYAAYGAADERDNVPVDRSVARLETTCPPPRCRIRVYAGSGHALYVPDQDERVVREDFLDELASWVYQVTEDAP